MTLIVMKTLERVYKNYYFIIRGERQMNVQKRELLKRQLERQAKLFALEDDTEETVVSILATCSALLREAENALTEEMTAETFDNIYPGYIGISKRMNAFYVTNKSMFDKKETEMVAGIHAAFEEDMQKMIRNVENAKDSYAELSAYQTELKRIQDALREDGYVNVESFSNKLEAMNQQSGQLMKDYDRFLKNVSQDVAELQNKIETRRKAGGV